MLINKFEYKNDVIGGIEKTDIKPFTQSMNIDERTIQHQLEPVKLNNMHNHTYLKSTIHKLKT